MDALVDTEWLAGVLGAPDLRVVDGSWYMPAEGRDARAEFARRHIPGAVYFDIDEIADRANPLPHMLPPADQFAAQVGALGIGDGDRVVVYDGIGLFSAPRVWWMLPRLRPRPSRGARRRPAQVAGRGPAGRGG